MTAQMLADAINAASAAPRPNGVGPVTGAIGDASLLVQSGTTAAAWVVRVTGVLPTPLDFRSDAMSQQFLAYLESVGAGINGKRVLVEFVNQQPIIAYALGDVISGPA